MLGFTKVGFQNGWKYPSISPTKVRSKNKTGVDQISNGRTVPFYGPGRKNLSIYLCSCYGFRGPLGFGPIQLLMDWVGSVGFLTISVPPSRWTDPSDAIALEIQVVERNKCWICQGKLAGTFFLGICKETSNLCKCQHASVSSRKEPLEPHNFLLGGWFRVAKNGSPPITSQKVIIISNDQDICNLQKSIP